GGQWAQRKVKSQGGWNVGERGSAPRSGSGRFAVLVLAHRADAALRRTNEGKQMCDGLDVAEFLFDLRQRERQKLVLKEEDVIRPPDGIDFGMAHAGPLHADQVDADNAVDTLLERERRHVLGRDRAAAEQAQAAAACELG